MRIVNSSKFWRNIAGSNDFVTLAHRADLATSRYNAEEKELSLIDEPRNGCYKDAGVFPMAVQMDHT